jgi:hypothetical protein
MILIEQVEQYGYKLVQDIPELKKFLLVLDDSQLTKFMSKISIDDNLILVGFIPSHETTGTNVDNVQNRDNMLWMVLNKVNRGDGMEAFVDSFKKCQLAAKEVEKQMLEDKPRFGNGQCTLMKQLEVASIKIDPVWALAGCDGYEINYSLLTPII